MPHLTRLATTGLALLVFASLASAQEQPNTAEVLDHVNWRTPESTSPVSSTTLPGSKKMADGRGFGLLRRFRDDQRTIWTSPAQIRFSDVMWLLPAGGLTAGLLAGDHEFSRNLSQDPKTISHYHTLSDIGLAALVGGASGLWLMGRVSRNEHWKETGLLAGEASIDSLVAVEALKYSLRRERPFQGDGSGAFLKSGTSFPSEHAAAAWAVAGVLAHEYPGPLTKVVAYGLASLVDYSRIRSRQHFPSDVFVGSIVGNLIAQNVYSRHHDPGLGGAPWHSVSAFFRKSQARNPGSPYVPIDSWVYPAVEQLAALGYVNAAFLGMRPWTRLECAHFVEEAGERIVLHQDTPSPVIRLYDALSREFRSNVREADSGNESSLHVESLYTSATEIAGEPLNDSYHFGQTIINNYGRPYQRGFNTYDGFSGWAGKGPFAFYVRGEYQHAPSAPGFSQQIQTLLGHLDSTPAQSATSIAAANQFRLLDIYIAANVANWDLTFGKQSLWWGPGEGGALLFSNNAEPIYAFRASRIAPFTLPWILRYLGPMKWDAFIGKLSGNDFPPRPVIHGEKISFKPTRNLEIGFTRMAEMGGVGRALTPAAFWQSYTSPQASNAFASNGNPGKRTAGFEFSYRVPLLRNWMVLYADSLSPDDVSPISAPRRAAINPGIYLAHFPKLPKIDLHVEALNTNPPSSSVSGHYVYYDNFYHDLSTNKSNIIGSWIGREGQGIQAWSNYWFGTRSSLQFGYRHAKVAPDFIPQGETLNDQWVKANWWVRASLSISASVQHEQWLAPVLVASTQTNWTSTVGITFHPSGLRVPRDSSRSERVSAESYGDGKP